MDADILQKTLDLSTRNVTGGACLRDLVARIATVLEADGQTAPPALAALIDEIRAGALDVQATGLAVKENLIALQSILLRDEVRRNLTARYELRQASDGSYVYALRCELAPEEAPHFICTHCKENGRKSILQSHGGRQQCPHCSGAYRVKDIPEPGASRSPPRWLFSSD